MGAVAAAEAMRRSILMILCGLGALFLVLALASVGFYFWASRGLLAPEALTQTRHYPAPEVAPSPVITVVTWNIGYLSGMTNNLPLRPAATFYEENARAAVAMLASLAPDILALQEIDLGAARSYDVDQVALLAEGLGLPHAAVAVNWDKRYVPFPYWPPKVHFGRMLSGQAVLSRWPVVSHQRVVLQKPAAAPFYYRAFYLDRLAQVVILEDVAATDKQWSRIVVINVHLEAFDRETREAQAKALREIIATHRDLPLIVLGDFNALPVDATQVTGFSDEPEADFAGDRTMHLLAEIAGLVEALPGASGPASFTFPADVPTRRLDYIFYSPDHFSAVEARVITAAGVEASDHLPVMLKLQ